MHFHFARSFAELSEVSRKHPYNFQMIIHNKCSLSRTRKITFARVQIEHEQSSQSQFFTRVFRSTTICNIYIMMIQPTPPCIVPPIAWFRLIKGVSYLPTATITMANLTHLFFGVSPPRQNMAAKMPPIR